jgi:hypothetical protein
MLVDELKRVSFDHDGRRRPLVSHRLGSGPAVYAAVLAHEFEAAVCLRELVAGRGRVALGL